MDTLTLISPLPHSLTITLQATGTIGKAILDALLNSGKFSISVLTRAASDTTHVFPPTTKVHPVDYSSPASLAAALAGIDAVVCTLPAAALGAQAALIAAAAAAGVARFVPSEYGSDTTHPRARTLPVYRLKVAAQETLRQHAAQGAMSYTLLVTGPFLDWGLQRGLLLDAPSRRAMVCDGGERPVSTSRLQTVGRAVVGVLERPEETRDRVVYVKDLDVSQAQLLAMAKKATPAEEQWDVQEVQTAELEQEAYEALKTEKPSMPIMAKFLRRAIYGEGYGRLFEKTDNELLGIPFMTEEELEELVAATIRKGSVS
jgi:uncharacterized protein YbjT (DUF2867 family)